MQFEVLGPLRVVATDGTQIEISSRVQRRLLSLLILHVGTPVSADHLGECLDLSPGALRVAVSRLRRLVGADALVTAPPGYELRAQHIDARQFEDLLREVRADHDRARRVLGEALDLWRGDAYAEFADEQWALAEARRLTELKAGATEDLVELLLDAREWTAAIALVEPLIAEQPFRDRPRGQLMRALADSGRTTHALRAFQQYRTLLADEVGTEPSEALASLDRRIARGAATAADTGAAGNLPVPTTSFVGRQDELRELGALVRRHRLVTLAGMGGVGKTRLATQLAADLLTEFPDGAWFVELAPVGTSSAVAESVAAALGVTLRSGAPASESLAQALASRRLLLVLDNCEHVVAAAAELADAITERTTAVTVIATSREPLGTSSEHVWPVGSFDVDAGPDSAAVALFVARAQQVNAGFASVVPEASDTVVEICRRLDGNALAIELAAARMVSMSPAEVLERLDAPLRLLADPRRAPERHQTLRRAVGWSYDLLDDVERAVLMRCAVFAGGFDLAGGVAVCGLADVDEPALLDVMDSLVRKSLATSERDLDAPRYGMLETVRQFAEDELASTGALDDVRDRHARFFADQVVGQFDVWDGPRQRDALDWVDVELPNLRAAFRWTIDRSDLDVAAAIAGHAAMMAMPLQRYEPAAWCEEVLRHAGAAELRELPRVRTGASFCVFSGRAEDAVAHARAAVALEADPRYDAFACGWAGLSELNAERYLGRTDRVVEISAGLAAEPGLAHVVGLSGLLVGLHAVGRAAEARALAPDALRAARDYGNPFLVAYALYGSGRAFTQTDPERARLGLREALEYTRNHRLPYFEAIIARDAAGLEAAHGDLHEALTLFDTAIERLQAAGADATLTQSLAYLAVVFERLARPDVAATVYGASATNGGLHAVIDLPDTLANLRAGLGDDAFDRYVGDGAAMELADAVAFARSRIRDTRARTAAR
ncbi:MAG: BTAD domain-containing putative transcriptional regulator [Acidimicrobiales bacterium]